MTRDTSIAVYRQIEAEGLLSQMRWEVYQALFAHGPATAGELVQHCHCRHAAINARLTELRQLGVARETQERLCRVTGRKVIEFDVTSRLPQKPCEPEVPRPLIEDVPAAIAHVDECQARSRRSFDPHAVQILADFAREQTGYTEPPPPKYRPSKPPSGPRSHQLF